MLVTITLFSNKGLLLNYQMRRCKDNEAIKTFIRELIPDWVAKDTGWSKNEIIKDANGWIRAGLNVNTGQRTTINVYKPEQ